MTPDFAWADGAIRARVTRKQRAAERYFGVVISGKKACQIENNWPTMPDCIQYAIVGRGLFPRYRNSIFPAPRGMMKEITRSEFMKCCTVGLCSCATMAIVPEVAAATSPDPEAEWLK